MARNTIVDVREKVEFINQTTLVELEFMNWGSGKYQLMNAETGENYGPVCNGATEFLTFLEGFYVRGRVK